MYDACVEAIAFVQGKNRKDLDSDRMLLLASLKAIEIIGEAAGRVSDETCHRFPAIPWQEIVSMRNRLIHGYFDINLDIVWKTLSEELPELKRLLGQALAELR